MTNEQKGNIIRKQAEAIRDVAWELFGKNGDLTIYADPEGYINVTLIEWDENKAGQYQKRRYLMDSVYRSETGWQEDASDERNETAANLGHLLEGSGPDDNT